MIIVTKPFEKAFLKRCVLNIIKLMTVLNVVVVFVVGVFVNDILFSVLNELLLKRC